MGACLSTSPLPALADPGRSQPLPPRGAPRGTSPPLRSSQPPVSRKLTPRASSRAARWGCRLRDLHGWACERINMPVSCLLSGFAFVSAFSVARGAPRTGEIPGSAGPRGSLQNAARRLGWRGSFARGGLVGTCPSGAASRALPGRGTGSPAPPWA